MAYYAALTSLSQTLDQIPQTHQQIISLREKVNRLLLILDDSPLKSSLAIKDLEGRIRDASYEAGDIVQSHISSQALKKSLSRRVSSFFRKMRRSRVGEEKICNPGILFPLVHQDLLLVSGDKSTVVGLDEDLLQIKDRLTGSPSKLNIISIVGMGGIGKTTLARNLYDDCLIEEHFHIHAWAFASQTYNMQEILTSLLNPVRRGGGDELQHRSIGELGEFLYKGLKGRRYLIVIDDIWDTKAWDDVKRFCPDDNNGSHIILTTRLSNVATHANSYRSIIHHMSLLSLKASWNLLRNKVYESECCPFELEQIGRQIAKNCKGLPLAIVGISGLLRKGSKTQEYWEYIAENVNSAITGDDDQFMKILSLSYDSLPHHLKACFLYIGFLPEDRVISISKFIKILVAEGFVKPSSHKSLEEVAKDYLNDLIDRSLIMICQRNHNGGAKTFVIHDLWRELCMKKAQHEEFFQIINSDDCNETQGGNNQCRVRIHTRKFTIPNLDSHVHTFLCFCRDIRFISQEMAHELLYMRCRLLRVFYALTVKFDEFPIVIVELVHLRYLALSCSGGSFPASISKLQNLQTLIVPFERKCRLLPPNIWEMPQLRYLIVENSYLPMKIKGKNYVVLENLQTLSGMVNLICSKEVLEMMPNLKKLSIYYDDEAKNKWSTYKLSNLVYLHQLEKLECSFSDVEFEKPVPVDFTLPANLKKLTLSGYRFSWEKMSIFSSLPNLEMLKLKKLAFEGRLWEPNEGEFSKLKFLLIDKSHLYHWRASDVHFPRLQRLIIRNCPLLTEIPSEIGDIPTLEWLELYNLIKS